MLSFEDDDWTFIPEFYSKEDAISLYKRLVDELPFIQHSVEVWGKVYPERRLSSFHSKNGVGYKYSRSKREVNPFTLTLEKIRKDVSKFLGVEFDAVLCNFYRDGNDCIGWHSDSEKELQIDHIASLSFGATRKFRLKSNASLEEFQLESGSLIYMHHNCQTKYKHCVPVEKKVKDARINLTFRIMK